MNKSLLGRTGWRVASWALALLMLVPATASAAAPTFTGNVISDFADPLSRAALDISDVALLTGNTSGWDLAGLWVYYEGATDTLHVGFDSFGIFGDADGDGDPGGTSTSLALTGGSDEPDLGGTESAALMIDTDADGAFDVVAGVPATGDISDFDVAVFEGIELAPGLGFGTSLAGNVGIISASPSAESPDLEFTITGFSTLLTGTQANVRAFAGSLADAGIGDDYVPNSNQAALDLCIIPGLDGFVACNPCVPDGGAEDVCDGIDNDCDGGTDEDYVASATSCGQGVCASTGELTCTDGVESDSCVEGTPLSADDTTCDDLDDDCDGTADDDFVSEATSCGVGACAATGSTSCDAGSVVDDCTEGTPAADDATCDGNDDDCDGEADEDFGVSLSFCGQGACANAGVLFCEDGAEVDTCEAGTPAADDTTCDGIDDDCSGEADEDFVGADTSCGVGACEATGAETCVEGDVVDTCMAGTPLSDVDATCDGVDDDCNGEVDEEFPVAATVCGQGACQSAGQVVCQDGAEVDTCEAGTPAEDDSTCDGVDDDCSGEADEDYVAAETTCGVGACASTGTMACVGGEVSDTCVAGAPLSGVDATCDGVDDDCNGEVDEEFPVAASVCGSGACQASGQITCEDGAQVDSCTPDAGAADEDDTTCDGVDDDCDGETDDDYQATPTLCGVGACTATGEEACQDGSLVDTCEAGDPLSGVDATCDGIDDDCDGEADEEFPVAATVCGQGACLSAGQLECQAGEPVDSCVAGTPASDDATCDGVDDDCDGEADDDFVSTPTTCGAGVCTSTGSLTCQAGAEVDTCSPPAPTALDDDCDGIDDDCDGEADDDWVEAETKCGEGLCEATGSLLCVDASQVDTCEPHDPPQGGTCIGPNCDDGELNGSETDVDCGGECINPCGTGEGCLVDEDCEHGLCLDDGTCADEDADDDGLPNDVEQNGGNDTDPLDPDSDGDGLCDGPEDVTDVCDGGEDTNANGERDEGESDPMDEDSDDDGFSDKTEVEAGSDPNDDSSVPAVDPDEDDNDGIDAAVEQKLGLDPRNPDSDGDGVDDLTELGDPDDPRDTDGDGIIDALDEDDDGDGIPTAQEVSDAEQFGDGNDDDDIDPWYDTDSDGDQVGDGLEGRVDNDFDGKPAYLDSSEDGTIDPSELAGLYIKGGPGACAGGGQGSTGWLMVVLLASLAWMARRRRAVAVERR